MGYDFFKQREPVYNYQDAKDIRDTFLAINQGKKAKIDKTAITGDSLFKVEAFLQEHTREYKNKDGFIHSYHSTQFSSIEGVGKELEDEPCVIFNRSYSNHDNIGSFLMKQLFARPNPKLIYAFALMEHGLNVLTWEQMDMVDAIDSHIPYHMYHDEEGDAYHDDEAFHDWRNSTGGIHLHHMHQDVSVSKLLKQEKVWENAHAIMMDKFYLSLQHTPLEQVEKWINEKDDAALFLRTVLYLLCNKFNITDYDDFTDPDNTELRASHSYGMIWTADDYLCVWDDYINGCFEGGLSTPAVKEYYFADAVIKRPGNHENLIQSFIYLFNYSLKKRKFDEKQNLTIQAYLRANRLPVWKPVLRRTIDAQRRRLSNGKQAADRRVYP